MPWAGVEAAAEQPRGTCRGMGFQGRHFTIGNGLTALAFLLAGCQVVKAFPEVFRRLEAIVHFARQRDGGGASFRIVSMSAKRPASASAIPRWNDSGIHESSDVTTNLATSARCLGGSALNCLVTVCALMPQMNHDGMSLASATCERAASLGVAASGPVSADPQRPRGSLSAGCLEMPFSPHASAHAVWLRRHGRHGMRSSGTHFTMVQFDPSEAARSVEKLAQPIATDNSPGGVSDTMTAG